jgi:hypothetical protein
MTLTQHERVDDRSLALSLSTQGFPQQSLFAAHVHSCGRPDPREDYCVFRNPSSCLSPLLLRGICRFHQYVFPKRGISAKLEHHRRLQGGAQPAGCSQRYSSLEGEDDGLRGESFVEHVIHVDTRAGPTSARRVFIGGRCRRFVDECGECLRERK